MRELLQTFLIYVIVIGSAYLIGKFFAKGLLKEIDLYFNKKFVDYKTKKEKNGKTEKTEQF